MPDHRTTTRWGCTSVTIGRRFHGWRPKQDRSDRFLIGGWLWFTWSIQREGRRG